MPYSTIVVLALFLGYLALQTMQFLIKLEHKGEYIKIHINLYGECDYITYKGKRYTRRWGFYMNKIDFHDSDNPVPGSAADIAKRQREYRKEKALEKANADIEKASETFPAFARILNMIKKES